MPSTFHFPVNATLVEVREIINLAQGISPICVLGGVSASPGHT
jgi:hypothetical protein